MKRVMQLTAFAVLLLVASFLYGQQTVPVSTSNVAPGVQAPACDHLFAANSTSNAFIRYCVSDRGTITSIETPAGHFHIGAQGEGYGFCQQDPVPGTAYYDFLNVNSGNLNPPTILNVNESSIKISRSTSDGNWTLVQTITKDATTGSAKIEMALSNHQAVDKVAYLMRFVDADPDSVQIFGAAAGASLQSAFAWNFAVGDGSLNPGLVLENAGAWTQFQHGYVRLEPDPPNPCDFANHADEFGFNRNSDTSLVYAYVGTVKAHRTATVNLRYRAR